MMLEAALEQVVSSLISSSLSRWRKSRNPEFQDFDFVVEREDGSKTAIEVIAGPPEDRRLLQIGERLVRRSGVDDFILVTRESPSPAQQQFFASALAPVGLPVAWYGVNDLPDILGVDRIGDLRTAEGLEALQMAALVSNAKLYEEVPLGIQGEGIPDPTPTPTREISELPSDYRDLRRQFSYRKIVELYRSDGELTELLGLGTRLPVTVVMTDIKSFSSLVKAARAEDLRDTMAKYYSKARELVWDHGGVLDKFIGDAVLAVFAYPSGATGSKDALHFSLDLIVLGQELLQNFADGMNEIIPTGTRVGVATGDIWPLNIGQQSLELSFVGDVINLAARLEKNCDVDGVLLSHTSRLALLRADGDLDKKLELEEKILSTSEAKGQTHSIRAWQLPPVPRSGRRAFAIDV